MDAPSHLLSLKVMRVSRPSLASSWQPFFTSSPSFSAHATQSLLSLQGKEPLPGHPKTLRDLTHASQLLTLPSSFGAIQLGETFTSCLCVNNEASVEVEGVILRIEMQTATSKVVLAEVGGPGQKLQATEVMEAIVSHEMKELGQHVLACYVSYRLPPSIQPPGPAGDPADPSLQTFRKYYKFAVTNPLNVKTKVHVPRSPTALLSRFEREKVFLEIHVQNLTQDPMWFERMHFECVDGWHVEDGNISRKDGKDLFSGSAAIMQPQDVRQYVYILTPISIPSFPVTHPPGTVIPLGRLDLSWRSSFGEPGRLLTSLLTRRIPVPAAQTTASAVPPHLQRSSTPVRPRSPQQVTSRPSTPPGSPAPFKPRPPSQQIGRPQSPAAAPPPSSAPPTHTDLQVDLIVCSMPHSDIHVEEPFNIQFELKLSGLLPAPTKTRLVQLLVQHLQPSHNSSHPSPTAGSASNLPLTGSPRASLASSRPSIDIWNSKANNHVQLRDTQTINSPSPSMSPLRGGVLSFGLVSGQMYNESPMNHVARAAEDTVGVDSGFAAISSRTAHIRLPAPISPYKVSGAVVALGSSIINLSPFALVCPAQAIPKTEVVELAAVSPRGDVMQRFECTFVPLRKGFARVGGLRVLLLDDREVDNMDVARMEELKLTLHASVDAKILREWDVIGEVWVTS